MSVMATTSPATRATIYHNQRCSTSRKVLALIEEAGIVPTIVKYLDTPPSRDGLRKLLDDAGLEPSQAIRTKEAVYKELGLAGASEDELIDAMVENPILIERPLVVTDRGTVLARPVEKVTSIL
ncbi:arsenate reductase (glutaredoxin) [Rhodococcus sp. Q]|jgi:arsenate reductase|uniref:arsenate reductase (glutaredoxin) n=1 Tax=Rhodococcus sp. Q TaxID=2502252 RepID=UPI0010F90BE8|nr:arsenate reductase (glutaredoxin) [Rhodococcus sp. Q]